MNIFWCNLAVLNNLICLDNRHLRVLAHCFIEVVLCFSELAVTEPIGFCDFDEGVITKDGFFHHVGFAVEFACFFWRSHFRDGTVGVVEHRKFTSLYCILLAVSYTCNCFVPIPIVPYAAGV